MPKDAYQTTDFYGKQHYYKVYCPAAKGTTMQPYCSLHQIGWYHEPDLLNKVPPDLSGIPNYPMQCLIANSPTSVGCNEPPVERAQTVRLARTAHIIQVCNIISAVVQKIVGEQIWVTFLQNSSCNYLTCNASNNNNAMQHKAKLLTSGVESW